MWITLVFGCIGGRNFLWTIINHFYDVEIENAVWGGNLLFVVGIAIFMSITYYYSNKKKCSIENFFVKAAMLSVIAYFVLCGSRLLRASMYFNLFYIVSLPYFIEKYKAKERLVLNVSISIFLMILFYVDTLAINQLDLCPYKFFWQ